MERNPNLSLLFLVTTTATLSLTMHNSSLLPWLILLLLALHLYHLTKPKPIYLVNFSCLNPKPLYRAPKSTFLEHTALMGSFDQESLSFMAKILNSSGQGDETYLPPSLHYIPPNTHHHESIKEAHMLLFPAIDDLFAKTLISPSDIDVLVVNCSGFCPCPSLSSIVVNRYKMRHDVKSFNLSGMGCSAGAIAIDLARSSLQSFNCTYAVILSCEILSTGWYAGKDRRKLLLNCLFRTGSSAVLLTNKINASNYPMQRPKYKLVHVLRTNRACDDKSYFSSIREEDSEGITGFSIEPGLLRVAAELLRDHVTLIGRSILPISEMMRYLVSILRKKLLEEKGEVYVPDFRSAIKHYCLPVSGLAVIREIAKGLRLREEDVEPAVATLNRFGNQSSAGMWYEMAYMEAKGSVRKGHRVWQLWMGSGPKSNSVIWKCLKDLDGEKNLWNMP